MKTVYLIKDQQEKFKAKYNRSYLVNAYRLVDEDGRDMVLPWFDNSQEAKDYADLRGWHVIDRTKED